MSRITQEQAITMANDAMRVQIDTSESDELLNKLALADVRIKLIQTSWFETPGELSPDLQAEVRKLERQRNEAIVALDAIAWGDPSGRMSDV